MARRKKQSEKTVTILNSFGQTLTLSYKDDKGITKYLVLNASETKEISETLSVQFAKFIYKGLIKIIR